MKKFLPFLILILLVGTITLSTYKLNKKQEVEQGQFDESNIHFVKTKIILPEFSLSDLFDENENFSKKDLVGKYSVINFFASWCATCRAEHEILMELQKEGIVDLYGIAWRDIDENTKKFLKRNGNPYKKTAKDTMGLFNRITGIEAIPETVIIDKEGNIVRRLQGNLQEFSIEEIKEFLQKN
jgi:cytochrome c biogenesis protein CcmG/thiol:disulfide interchange protein DsbE